MKNKEFNGTISQEPYKFYAETQGDKSVIYVSIFKENDKEFNTKEEPRIRLAIYRVKHDNRVEILRSIGGVHIAATEFEKIAAETIKQIDK